MKKWIKRVARVLAVVAVALVAAVAFSPQAYAANKGWAKIDGWWYYYENDGTLRKDNWASYNGQWYYFGSDGKLVVSDFVPYGDNFYYIGANGTVVRRSGWINRNEVWYYIDSTGKMLTKTWVKYRGSYYYLNEAGQVVISDWVDWNGNWYYCGADGKPYYNCTVSIDGWVNHFDAYGVNDMWYQEDVDLVELGYGYYSQELGCSYYVPLLNISSPYCDKVYAQFEQVYYLVLEQEQAIANGEQPDIWQIDYYWCVYGDNLSIELWTRDFYSGQFTEYVWNINLTDGTATSFTHLMQLVGMTTDQYATWLYNTVKEDWDSTFPEEYASSIGDFYYTQRNKTLSYDNLASAMLSIEDDGTLYVCYKRYGLAGPEYTYEWINTGSY